MAALERDSIEVIPNPLSIPTDPVARNEEIDSLWGDASVRVLSVGALKPEKNHKLLLEAFADFARERDARLIIVGEGPLRPVLEKLADQMGIAERVCLPGFRADPWPFYASAHLFVLTSQSEGFGNVLVEAMAAGLPIVSTDCAGPREILDGGKWGALVPVGDRGALTHAMAQSIDVPIDRDSLRARARQYSPDMISNSYLAALLGSGQLKADRS